MSSLEDLGIQTPTNCKHRKDGEVLDPNGAEARSFVLPITKPSASCPRTSAFPPKADQQQEVTFSKQEQSVVEEIKEQQTEEVKPVELTTQAPDSITEQLESKTQPVSLNKTAIKQQNNALSVGHKTLHSKQSSSKEQPNQSRPSNVVRSSDPNTKQPQPLSSIAFKKSVQTWPYMKGSIALAVMEIFFHLFQRSYCDALMSTRGLELLYQGYRGYGISGLVELQGSKNSLLRAISPNTEVEILSDDYHSSYFKDYPKQMQVYIKPLKNAQDWLGGIAVLIDQLLPLRIREFNVKSNKIINKTENRTKTY